MAKAGYVPDRGDFVWLDLDPRRGHEQAGHRPALVLSPLAFNGKSGLCVICPATSKPKGYPFEVPNPDADSPKAVILAEHMRCVDWRARRIRFIRQVAQEVLDQVVAKIDALIINPEG
jgi:mRNA interferase MazF